MGDRTPDAYRISAGQVAQEYPADAVPVRLSKQPSLPTMSRASQAPPVERRLRRGRGRSAHGRGFASSVQGSSPVERICCGGAAQYRRAGRCPCAGCARGASRAQRATRRAGVGASRMDRRERPARRGQHYRGLLMFLLGFISALLVVAAVVGGRFFARSTAASGFANAVDSCHARGLHARLASDETSLTLEAFSDSGDSLTTPIFQCVLGKLGTRAAARERMYATRAIDGTQSEQWGSYKATWTYEPDQGLTVIVSSR